MRAEGDALLSRRIFWTALAIRLLYITLAHTYRIRPYGDHFQFGWEAGRIARALVTGYGYADPFANFLIAHTGPTAWLPPLYPLLLAGVFRLLGVYTPASAWLVFAINSVLGAWTAVAVVELGRAFRGRANGLWAGWIWALYPAAMQYDVRWAWEMSLTTAFFAWAMVFTMRLIALPLERAIRRWLVLGLLWGGIALSNSSLLIFLPACAGFLLAACWSAQPSRGGKVRRLLHPLLAGLILAACIAPWTLRNLLVLHAFVPFRSNLGVEMYLGNGPNASGFLMEYNHPYFAGDQLRLYARMGEISYAKMRGEAARAVIGADPVLFLRNTLRRVFFFWASVPDPADDAWYVELFRVLNYSFISLAGLLGLGLALRRRRQFAGLWAWAFLLLPLPYYAITAHARFRHPLEPLICVLGVYLFQSAQRRAESEPAFPVDAGSLRP